MSPAVVLAIGAIGGVGAIARFLLDGAVSSRLGRRFPFGPTTPRRAPGFTVTDTPPSTTWAP